MCSDYTAKGMYTQNKLGPTMALENLEDFIFVFVLRSCGMGNAKTYWHHLDSNDTKVSVRLFVAAASQSAQERRVCPKSDAYPVYEQDWQPCF